MFVSLSFPQQSITFFEWSPPWHIIPTYHLEVYIRYIYIHIYITTYIIFYLTFLLAYTLTLLCYSIWHLFWYSSWHSFWHSFWHLIWHLFWHYFWHSFWHSFWHCVWHLFWHSLWHGHCWCPLRSGTHGWGLAVPTEIRSSQLRSGSAHWDPELGWGPAVPTEMWSSQLRSGSAHWDVELAVEVRHWDPELAVEARQRPLRCGACCRHPEVPIEIWSSQLRSGSSQLRSSSARPWAPPQASCITPSTPTADWVIPISLPATKLLHRSRLFNTSVGQPRQEVLLHHWGTKNACAHWDPKLVVEVRHWDPELAVEGSAHWDLELVVEVRQYPLRSGASQLRSGSAHWDLELAVEVRQCPLRSGARSWGPAVPPEIRSSQLRSGSAHWYLDRPVEVRQCPMRSGARSWGPAVSGSASLRNRNALGHFTRATLHRNLQVKCRPEHPPGNLA